MLKKVKRLHCQPAESGSVLITVVWMTVVFSIVAVTFSSRLMGQLSFVQRLEGDLRAYYLLRAGAEQAKALLRSDVYPAYDSCKEGFCDDKAQFKDQALGDGTYTLVYRAKERALSQAETRYGLEDEGGKINLNTASARELERLFEQTVQFRKKKDDEDYNGARELAHAVLDWRDEDSDRRDFGAEKFEYLDKKYPYEAKDGPFESLDELLLVQGVTPAIFEAVKPYLTVYGQQGVNVHTAPEKVLMALGFSTLGANTILGLRNGPDGIAGTEDDQEFADLNFFASEVGRQASAEDANVLAKLLKRKRLTVGSDVFSFTIAAQPKEDGDWWKAYCVINRQGDILAWHENSGVELDLIRQG